MRVLVSLDRNLQRLGFGKWILHRSQQLGSSTGENLGHDLVARLTERNKVRVSHELADYFTKRGLRRYKDAEVGSHTNVELQHLYLSDPGLPSSTGNLVARDSRRYPWLIVGLGLLREGTYSLTERGNSILQLSLSEIESFKGYSSNSNPLLIATDQKALFLHSVLQKDGEAIGPLFARLLEDNKRGFSEADAARFLPAIYQDIVRKKSRALLSIRDREVLTNLEGTAQSIQAWMKSNDPNLGAWKHAVRFRLEAMVDVGWLTKPKKHGYGYQFTDIGLQWIPRLSYENARELDEFLRSGFASALAETYYDSTESDESADAILQSTYQGWNTLKGAQGYVPIDELALYSAVLLLRSDGRFFRHEATKSALLEANKARPNLLRFTVDRRGALAHVRFLQEP